MPRVVFIANDVSVKNYYEDILQGSRVRFHNYQPHFTEVPMTEKEMGQIETMNAYAEHARTIAANERIVR